MDRDPSLAWLVLGSQTDHETLWLARELAACSSKRVELVTAEMLACAQRWNFEVTTNSTDFEILLADGRCLRREHVAGTVNRLSGVPVHAMQRLPAEWNYAECEWSALLLAWLHSLPGPILNPPSPTGLCGAWRTPVEWAFLARNSGLPLRTVRGGQSNGSWEEAGGAWGLVVGRTVLGMPQEAVRLSPLLVQLAAISNSPLLGVHLTPEPERGWVFTGATTVPSLRPFGQSGVDAILLALESR